MKDKNKNAIYGVITLAVLIVLIAVVTLLNNREMKVPVGTNNVVTTLMGENQAEIDEKIKADLEKNQYSLRDAKVYFNPYNASPLGALIVFKTDKETAGKVIVKGKHGDDVTMHFEKDTYHYVPVYTLYVDYENTVSIELDTGESKTFTIKTNHLEDVPRVTKNLSEESVLGNELYFISSPLDMTSYAFDKYGEVRWLTGELYYHNIEFMDNGHLLIGTEDITDDGLASKIIEIDLLGRIYNEYTVEDGYLNSILLKKDGNIIVASKKKERDTYSDYIVELDKNTGKIIKTWDVYALFESIDANYTNSLRADYFYNSGIYLDEKDDNLVLTYWGGEFVLNLSYTEGTIKWLFANPANFSSAFSGVLLDVSPNFVYPKSMHSASMEEGVLRVFDNGYSTLKGDEVTSHQKGLYSRAVQYSVGEKTITQLRSIDENKAFYSYALGDYKKVDNKELILFGRELKGIDYNREENISDYNNVVSRVQEYVEGRKVLDVELGNGALTVDKISLEGGSTFNFEPLKSHSSVLPSEKEPITDGILRAVNSSTYNELYKIGFSKNVIECNVLFMRDDEAKLVLVDEEKNGAVYTIKERGIRESKKIVTDLPAGKYQIFILENDKMYNIDSYIEIE